MEIPVVAKKLAAVCDPTSRRYPLGAIYFERQDGENHAVSTDGRCLAHMSWPAGTAETEPFSVLLEGKRFAAIKEDKKRHPFVLDEASVNGTATVTAYDTTVNVPVPEGRFPRWRDVIPDYRIVKHRPYAGRIAVKILLDADLLVKLLKTFPDNGGVCRPVEFLVPVNGTSGVIIRQIGTGSEYAHEGIIMPLEP